MLYGVTLLLCLALRLLPHPFNLTPMGASAVFAGRTLPVGWALALVGLGMVASNVALAQLHGYPVVDSSTPFVFAGFGFQVLLGRAFRSARWGALAAALTGSLAFFLVSNLGVFLGTALYPRSVAGLGACYAAALPFLRNTLAGDLLWTLALTPLYAWAARQSPGASRSAVTASA